MGLYQEWLPLLQPVIDDSGCGNVVYPPNHFDFVALVKRGECAFFEKLATAKLYGALGVVVWGAEEDGGQLIRPSAEGDPVEEVDDVGIVYIPFELGKSITDRMKRGEEMSVAFAGVEELDVASLTDLLTQQQEQLRDILGDVEFNGLLETFEAIDLDKPDLDIAALQDLLSKVNASIDTEKGRMAAADSAIPAGVTMLGLPIANLFIMPTR